MRKLTICTSPSLLIEVDDRKSMLKNTIYDHKNFVRNVLMLHELILSFGSYEYRSKLYCCSMNVLGNTLTHTLAHTHTHTYQQCTSVVVWKRLCGPRFIQKVFDSIVLVCFQMLAHMQSGTLLTTNKTKRKKNVKN